MAPRVLARVRAAAAGHEDLLVVGVAFAASGVARVASSAIIGSRGGAELLGAYTLLVSVATFGSLLAAAGYQSTVLRFLAEARGRGNLEDQVAIAGFALRGAILSAALGSTAVFVAISVGLVNARLTGGLAVTALAIIGCTAYYSGRGILLGRTQFMQYALLEVVAMALLLAAATTMPSYVGWAFGLTQAMVGLPALASALPGFAQPLNPILARRVRRFLVASVVGTAASMAGTLLGPLVLERLRGLGETGILGAAVSIVLILRFFPDLHMMVLTPRLSFLLGSGEYVRARSLLMKATIVASGVGLLILAGSLVLGPRVVAWVYGPVFAKSAHLIAVFALGVACFAATRPALAYLLAQGREIVPNAFGVAALVINVALWPLLVPSQGALGIAWANTIGTAVASAGIAAAAFVTRRSPRGFQPLGPVE